MKRFTVHLVAFCLVLLLGFPLEGHCFFTASEISLVKDTPLPADKSITYGKLFDTYKHCKDGKWEVKKDDRGRTYVEFKGKYSNVSLALALFKDIEGLNDHNASLRKIADYIDSLSIKLDLVAQFVIGSDGKNFSQPFISFGYKGKTGSIPMSVPIGFIQNNAPCGSDFLPVEVNNELHYYLKKYLLNNFVDINSLRSARIIPIAYNMPESKIPIVIFEMKKFDFDDKALKIQMTAKYQITDLTPEMIINAGIQLEPDVINRRASIDLNSVRLDLKMYSVVQESEKILEWVGGNHTSAPSFHFSSSDHGINSRFRMTKLEPKSNTPIEFSWDSASFKMPDATAAYVQSVLDSVNAADRAKRDAARKEYESNQGNPFARDRDTPAKHLQGTKKQEQPTKPSQMPHKTPLQAKDDAGKSSYIGYVEEYNEAGMPFMRLNDNQERHILFLGASFEIEGALNECVTKALEGEYPIEIVGKLDENQVLIKDASVICRKYISR